MELTVVALSALLGQSWRHIVEFARAYVEVLPTNHRRALQEAADELINTTIENLGTSYDSDWSANNWLIGTMLPPRYELKYTGDFARKFFVCLITVVWKLGQREIVRPSCVAEELAVHVLIEEAKAVMQERGEEADFGGFEDVYFEDLDFEFLYDDAYDGIEISDLGEQMGVTNLAFAEWFARFGPPESPDYLEVHPYAADDDTSPASPPADELV